MYNILRIQSFARERLSPGRLSHTEAVVKMARGLAAAYGEEPGRAGAAAWLHDVARDMDGNDLLRKCVQYGILIDKIELAVPELLHGPLAAEMARRELGLQDGEILRAVSRHTTGGADMTPLEMVLFLADHIEPGRDYPGVAELRALAGEGLEVATYAALGNLLHYLVDTGALIHPRTLEARNWLTGRRI